MCNQCQQGQPHPQQPPHLPYGVKSFAPPMGRANTQQPPWMPKK
jgi:hypothetical protein